MYFPLYMRHLDTYESSEENMIRSISIYYSGSIAGKQKYRKVYKNSCYKINNSSSKNRVRLSEHECPIPRLVLYHKLMSFIKSIPIGNLYSVYSALCDGFDEDEKVFGCYRSLKDLLVSLAEFYLSGHSGHTLTWFGKEYTFSVTLGGDGAPFEKDDTACAWLVGFLNIGRGIVSSNKNHLLFGANCSENCIPVKRYIKLLLADIQSIERTVFPCKYNGREGEVTINVEFRIAELPNDMKMIAFLSGELGNSATFFSSFANVCNDNAGEINGTFGEKANNTWHSWEYSVRLSVVKKVDVLKKTLSRQKLAQHTKRSKITALIEKHARVCPTFRPHYRPHSY